MFLVFFLLWLLLNGHFSPDVAFLEIVLFGLAVSGVLFFFLVRFTRWDLRFEFFFLRNFPLFFLLGLVVFRDVVTANFAVILTVLNPKESPDPTIVSLRIPLKNEMLRSILANSITLTPGTITISETESHFLVHCLKKEYIEGIENSATVKILLKLEERL